MTRRIDASLISANNISNSFVLAASGGLTTFISIANVLTAGDNITIAANGRISSTGGGGSGGSGVTTVKVDSFVANGSQTSFALSIAPQAKDYTFVNIDGVEQLRSAYSLSGSTIILSEAPSANANIDVTTFYALSNSTVGQPAFVTRTYTGTGSQTNFTVTSNVISTGILVTENGILQTPETDYTVSGNVLTFTTAPASNVAIQIRELGTVVSNITYNTVNTTITSTGSSNARVMGYNLVFGL